MIRGCRNTSRITKCSFQESTIESHTFVTASQSESRQASDDAKDILRENSRDLALLRVRPMYRDARSRSCDYLLLFRASELSEYCLCNGRRRLDRERVHEHRRCSRHVAERGTGRPPFPLDRTGLTQRRSFNDISEAFGGLWRPSSRAHKCV